MADPLHERPSVLREVRACLSRSLPCHVHLAGISGVGMAGLAGLLKERGLTVTGCDAAPGPLAEWLEGKGIRVTRGHSCEHMASADWLIRSAAVPETVPEIEAARAKGLPVFRRGEVLPALLEGAFSVAVAGTHGKTTTTALIAQVFRRAGRSVGYCVGGETPGLDGPSAAGTDVMVVEADESDGTLALYAPTVAVVTNIEMDHLEHFAGMDGLRDCFRRFVRQAKRVVCCVDDPEARALVARLSNVCSYGLGEGAHVRADNISEHSLSSVWTLCVGGQKACTVDLPLPGLHNIRNALAAAAVALEAGLSPEEIRERLQAARLPRRRFDRLVDRPDFTVISDYAHHPTEIRALMAAAIGLGRNRVRAIFQPHRYTRTRALGPEFPSSFGGAQEVVLLPVYPASEEPLEGGTIFDLYAHFRRAGVAALLAPSMEAAWAFHRRTLRAGDMLLVVGAGDVEWLAKAAAEWAEGAVPLGEPASDLYRLVGSLRLPDSVIRVNEPLAGKTAYGVGGTADIWAEISSEEDLVAARAWAKANSLPFWVLGGGFNVLVSDLGLRGVVVRLVGPVFRSLRREGAALIAGAGTPLSRLVDMAEAEGLEGFEFLEGIPGTVGGALHGNAGAWGHCVGEITDWMRVLEPDGTFGVLKAQDVAFAYRACPSLEGQIVMECAMQGREGSREAIRRRREDLAQRRAWLRGLRCAGSVFRNPPNDRAGRLLEAAGMKGRMIGGAKVSEMHANVIVTEPGATASDVRALMELARSAVERRFGVVLQPEVVCLE